MSINTTLSMTQPLPSRCATFDERVEPSSTQDILVALRMHPSSGDHGISLFDKSVLISSRITKRRRRRGV